MYKNKKQLICNTYLTAHTCTNENAYEKTITNTTGLRNNNLTKRIIQALISEYKCKI